MNKTLIFNTRINRHEEGKTVLSLLSERFTYLDQLEWSENIAAGKVRLNGDAVSCTWKVSIGDNLTYHPDSLDEPEVSTDAEVIDSSPDFLLTGKPAGIPVSRTGRIVCNTFINILRDRFNNPDIHLMHRLDRETSGLLLCAKSKEVCRKHQKNLARIMTGKYYLAIVQGRIEVNGLRIEFPLGKDPNSEIRCQVTVAPNGKPSSTIIYTVAATNEKSMLLARLVTGRRHQLRCHLSHLGHPIIGDKIYNHGGKFYLKRLTQELTDQDFLELQTRNHTLHAWAADITLPGQEPRLYHSHSFPAEFIHQATAFPGWRNPAAKILEQARNPKITHIHCP
ncbi:MAG: RNA pseudouridine synthase [Proteobacteria bacterium]|nr:RNA pseudouridine synthase [Pseudomonadota bacterium]MBU1737006.1 RNA pseudouridine synthase [Pseudomonadota bacterium]